jgi:histidinol-phosphate aminotransferase
MSTILSRQQQDELLNRGFSRRTFGRIATLLTAGAALPFYNEPALAQRSRVDDAPADSVWINSNENPLGPCKEAREAAHAMVENGGRYLFGETSKVQTVLSEQESLKPTYVAIHAGSSNPLHQSVLAFCSPTKPYITADPGYESGGAAAAFIGAPVIKVKLAKDYSHDVKAMAAASPTAGLIYICNPNNPTGTLTKRSDLEWLVANKPAGSIVMIDEAYTHISGAGFCSDLVAADKDVVILRTFSKIYGMAGLRAGAALARPDLLRRINGFSTNGMMPITAMAAAKASLEAKYLVPQRRKLIGDVREDVLGFLDQHGYKCVPSVSNCFMVDTRRPAREVIQAMQHEKVIIGRPWDIWPTHVRVTVGLQDEMDRFKAAFLKVMA